MYPLSATPSEGLETADTAKGSFAKLVVARLFLKVFWKVVRCVFVTELLISVGVLLDGTPIS